MTLKKGAYLLRCGRRGKPKFCPFRLSTVVTSFMAYILREFFTGMHKIISSWSEQSLKNWFFQTKDSSLDYFYTEELLKILIYLKYEPNFQTLEAS